MAAPSSLLDIVNLALLRLYATPIQSLTQNTVAARVANATYDQSRRSLLRQYRWNFANARGLAQLSTTVPAFDYQAQYTFPADLLRLLQIGAQFGQNSTNGQPVYGNQWSYKRYEIQGRSILVDPICELNFYAGNSAWVSITGVSQANPGTVVAPGHTFSNGDEIQIINVVGMTQLNNNYYLVANPTVNTFQLQDLSGNPLNTIGYSAYASGGSAAEGTPEEPPVTGGSTGTPPPNIPVIYVRDETNIGLFDSLFVDALTIRLAIDMCMPVTGNKDLMALLWKAYDICVKEAQGVNFQEMPQEVREFDPIAASRVAAGNITYPNGGSGWEGW